MSLADELRTRSDEELDLLFQLRPDLITPVPSDMTALAARATSAPSLMRALERLNQWQLNVLTACAIFDDPFAITEVVEVTEKRAKDAINDLYQLALIYRDDKKFRMPRNLREVIGQYPASLGPKPARPTDFAKLDKAPKAARDLLEKLLWDNPVGEVADIKANTSVTWLLDNHLLVPLDSKRVALPRDLGLHLRGGKVFAELSPTQPELSGKSITQKESDRAAIAAIATLLRLVEELMNFWSEETPSTIQSGGLGVRDLKKAAEHLDVEEAFAGFIAELSYLAGILTIDSSTRILPTSAFDIWEAKPAEERWRDLVSNWRITSRVIGLVGRADAKSMNALSNELDRSNAALIRSMVLESLQPDLAPTLESLQKRVIWRYPHRRGISYTKEMVAWTAREAEWLGITGGGALSTFGARFLTNEDDLRIDKELPKPVDYILIQSDNTAIAPGPLTIELARNLSTFADIESRGGATVYRFSESSIRRGLDHGHSGDEIKEFLTKNSKTPLPQPLIYLIADVARKFGQLRIGNASTYIRSDDEATISAMINDKRIEDLRLQKIASTVAISPLESGEVMETLRANGYFPAGENQQGTIIAAPAQRRAQIRPRPPRILSEIPNPTRTAITSIIRALRSGAESEEVRTTREIPRTPATETLALLNQYLGKNVPLLIGYADVNGGVNARIIDPLSISLGTLIARDHMTNGIIPLKIARITGVTLA